MNLSLAHRFTVQLIHHKNIETVRSPLLIAFRGSIPLVVLRTVHYSLLGRHYQGLIQCAALATLIMAVGQYLLMIQTLSEVAPSKHLWRVKLQEDILIQILLILSLIRHHWIIKLPEAFQIQTPFIVDLASHSRVKLQEELLMWILLVISHLGNHPWTARHPEVPSIQIFLVVSHIRLYLWTVRHPEVLSILISSVLAPLKDRQTIKPQKVQPVGVISR